MNNLRYLWYVLKHKYYVFKGGRIFGVGLWQLLIHDLSKFSRHEWTPYVNWFHRTVDQDADGFKKQQLREDFERALNHHFNHNPHHWEYWLLYRGKLGEWIPQENAGKGVVAQFMPEKYIREMLADWYGAGFAKDGVDNVVNWWQTMHNDIVLHDISRMILIDILEEVYGYDIFASY